MKERDKELENNDVYQRKILLESLYLINQNLSKLLKCISELEGSVNQVGKSQDMLINAVQLTSDIYVKGKEMPPAYERQRSEMASPKFDPRLASFDIDPYLPKHIKEENKLENSLCSSQSVYSLHY